MKKRIFSLLLILCLMLSLVPFGTLAEDVTEPTEVTEVTETTETTETTVVTEATETTETTEATGVTETTEVTEPTEITEATEVTEPVESEPTAAQKVQSLIDALPETVTAENREAVETQLTAIDDAKLPLTDEEREGLDFGKYNAAIAALNELDGMAGAEVPETLTNIPTKAQLRTGMGVNGTFCGWNFEGTVSMEETYSGSGILMATVSDVDGSEYKFIVNNSWDSSWGNGGSGSLAFGPAGSFDFPKSIYVDGKTAILLVNINNYNETDGSGMTHTVQELPEGEYLITLNPNGGTLPSWESGICVTNGQKLPALPTPTKSDNAFLGWYSGETKWDTSATVSENMTLTAKWSDGSNVTSEAELKACIEAGISNITLGADIDLQAAVKISGTVTLDLNGHKLKNITDWKDYDYAAVAVLSGGKLIITDSGTSGKIIGGKNAVFIEQNGSVTLNSGTITVQQVHTTGSDFCVFAQENSEFIMNGGMLNSNECGINSSGTTYINGGNIEVGYIKIVTCGIVYLGSNVDAYDDVSTESTGFCRIYFMNGTRCYAVVAVEENTPIPSTFKNPTAPTGTVLAGWVDEDNKLWDVSSGVTENMTLTARFDPITYTITYDKGEMTDAKGDIDKVQKEHGDDKFTLSQKVYTKDGYLQVGWVDAQSNFYLPGAAYKENDNLTLTAVWEKIITHEVPFTKTVKLAGSTKPGKVTFELHALPYGDYSQTPGKVDVTGTVETNGKGNFEGTLTITGSETLVQAMLADGIFVQEKNDGQKNWKYDSTIYWLTMPNDDILIYPVTVKTVDKETVYIPNEDKTVKTMTFTNTYGTSSNADTSNPKTGDTIYIAAATMLLSTMALIAIVPKRKGKM